MATGAFDGNGVWIYGEDDDVSPFSTYSNLGQNSVSIQFTADRARLASLETGAANNVLLGIDADGWTGRIVSGKRVYQRFFDGWSGLAFGATGGSNFTQSRATGIKPPTGHSWDEFICSVDVWPTDTSNNALQAVIRGFVAKPIGTGSTGLSFINPSSQSVPNTFMSLCSSITLTEK